MKLQLKNKWEFFYLLSLGMIGTINGQETTIDNLDLSNWDDNNQFCIIDLNKVEVPSSINLTETIDGIKISYKQKEIVVKSNNTTISFRYGSPIFDICDYIEVNIANNMSLLKRVVESDKIIKSLNVIDLKIKHLLIDKLQEMKEYDLENFTHYESDNFLITYDKETELYEYRTKQDGCYIDITMFSGSPIVYSQKGEEELIELLKTDKTIEKYLPCSVEMIISDLI